MRKRGAPDWRIPLVASLLVAAIAGVYSQALEFPFVGLDDPAYVSHNARVAKGLSLEGLGWAFRTMDQANWHPLTWVSYMLDVSIFGRSPGPLHAVNIALHATSAVLLLLLLAAATDRFWASACVAGLFALHPLSVESVVWISQRKDVLSTALLWITLILWLSWTRRGGRLRYASTLSCYAAGLLVKPMLVTVPFLLLLLDYWPLARRDRPRERLFEKLPFFALSAFSCALTFVAQRRGGSVASTEIIPLAPRLNNALVSYCAYLQQAFWPSELAIFYPHPWILGHEIDAWKVIPAAILLSLVSALAVAARSRRPYLLVGWLWFLGAAVPVIGIVQVGGQAMADRYTYVPLVGVFVALAFLASEWVSKRPWRRPAAAGLATAIFCALGVASIQQLSHWRDNEALFVHAIAVTQGNWIAHTSLGTELESQGRFDAAIENYRSAISAAPRFDLAHYNLATVLMSVGRLSEAGDAYERVLEINPMHLAALNNLGVLRARQGDFDAAIALLERALSITPGNATTRANLERALRFSAPRAG